jgi:hypothetical protein
MNLSNKVLRGVSGGHSCGLSADGTVEGIVGSLSVM